MQVLVQKIERKVRSRLDLCGVGKERASSAIAIRSVYWPSQLKLPPPRPGACGGVGDEGTTNTANSMLTAMVDFSLFTAQYKGSLPLGPPPASDTALASASSAAGDDCPRRHYFPVRAAARRHTARRLARAVKALANL